MGAASSQFAIPRTISDRRDSVLNVGDVTDKQIDAIPGWFDPLDVDAFRLMLTETAATPGDLAELGVYHGKSAVLIGSYLQPGETFTVIDLFGTETKGVQNRKEIQEQYPELTREPFEEAYKGIHGSLPRIVVGHSSTITEHALRGTHRFVHIDASHLYEQVRQDISAARTLLRDDGVVVLDDYRNDHTPGVAAAAWQAVNEGLHPFLISPAKMYATWGDPAPFRAATNRWARADHLIRHESQALGIDEVIRVWKERPKVNRFLPPVVAARLAHVRAKD